MDGVYLIWSNEHRAWWGPNSQGYTIHLERAGRYDRDRALAICRVRDQYPGEPLPELPIREDDLLPTIQPIAIVKLPPGYKDAAEFAADCGVELVNRMGTK